VRQAPISEATVAERTALSDDLRMLAFAHASLDELGVPRWNDGRRLTLFGRIEALRAGKYDPERLTGAEEAPVTCPSCGWTAEIYALR
jgi:hypothetical protein